ncbi:hypothetical protein GCM10027594_06760 [Hymenobacter agri]|uniref:Uncharacterized protein n=1 Tax=Hymenobacter jeollabukensis TaxID=2025313 RepID=A0A5R8WHX9_9BACT|nr:hypothetical protein [Hymenobacter jeollabukensis]TLM88459.1 hypothetical protein FDY95_24160 [Hymenobacter jeollabukensis]
MKNKLLIALGILLAVMVFTNPAETEMQSKITNSELVGDLSMARAMKNATPMMLSLKTYYMPEFKLNRVNFLIGSLYNLKYGWHGTINGAGMPLSFPLKNPTDTEHNFTGEATYLGVLGQLIPVSRNESMNYQPQ